MRRIERDAALTGAAFAPDFQVFVARAAPRVLHVVDLAVGRRIETVIADRVARIEGAAAWSCGRQARFALPDVAPTLRLLDGGAWKPLRALTLTSRAMGVHAVACDRLEVELDRAGRCASMRARGGASSMWPALTIVKMRRRGSPILVRCATGRSAVGP